MKPEIRDAPMQRVHGGTCRKRVNRPCGSSYRFRSTSALCGQKLCSTAYSSTSFHRLEALKTSQGCPNLILVLPDTSSIIHLLSSLSRNASAHICASSSRQQSCITERIDSLLPFLRRFWRRIDVFDALIIDLIDGISDPSALYLYTAGTAAEVSKGV